MKYAYFLMMDRSPRAGVGELDGCVDGNLKRAVIYYCIVKVACGDCLPNRLVADLQEVVARMEGRKTRGGPPDDY